MDFEEFAEVANYVQMVNNLGWQFNYYGTKAKHSPEGKLPCLSCTKSFDGKIVEKCFYSIGDFYDWLMEPME